MLLSPALPSEIVDQPDRVREYLQSPENQAAVKSSKSYPMMLNADGKLVAEDVPSGAYTLFAHAMLQPADQKAAVWRGQISVTVPADPPSGKLDVGTITLK